MRILVIICTGFVPWGGLTTVAMNYYRAMDKQGMIIDFASNNVPTQDLIDELEKNGSQYIKLPPRKKIFSYDKKLCSILKGYDVVHIHGNSATMSLELFPAVMCGVPKRIVHCHTTVPTAKKLSKFLRPVFLKMYTHAIAVSKEAGDWLYGEDNFVILNNAIPVSKYQFDLKERTRIRLELGIGEGSVVIGNIAKINIQKNHTFILEIFQEIQKKLKGAKLLLVGDGPLRKQIEEKAKQLKIYDDIYFIGMSNTPTKWLQAMDYFLFPSNYEGFGLALLEAQANGVKCFASDVIPALTNATGKVKYISLKESAEAWASEICNTPMERMPNDFIVKKFRDAYLDITTEAEHLKNIYEEKL